MCCMYEQLIACRSACRSEPAFCCAALVGPALYSVRGLLFARTGVQQS